MNVVAVWWVGGNGPGTRPYGEEYVRALRSQVPEIQILSTEVGRPLRQPGRFRGWAAKLEVFAPWNEDLRPCLCIDLDTFVFDLDPILDLDPERLWMIREFFQGERGRGETGLFIAPKDTEKIWNAAQHQTDFSRGDGAFVRQFDHRFITDEVSGIYSYKAHHLAERGPPPDARVICFHGKPKPHEATGWAKDLFDAHV